MIKRITIESDDDKDSAAGKTAETESGSGGPEQTDSVDKTEPKQGGAEQTLPEKNDVNSDSGLQPGDAKKKIEELEKTGAGYLDHLQRMKAEFENYKRRTNKEKEDAIKYGVSVMAEKLLGVMDNLQRGLNYAAESEADKKILEGMRMVERQMTDVLAEFDIKPFDSLGEDFDPNIHQPLYTIERDNIDENMIVEEIEKGYRIHDRLLRPAKVAVSRRPSENGGDSGA